MQLTNAMQGLLQGLSAAERTNLATIFTLGANGLTEDGVASRDRATFEVAARLILELRPDKAVILENAICWRGRPSFVSDADLVELRADSQAARGSAVLDSTHFVAKASSRAFEIASSQSLVRLVSESSGLSVEPTGVVSFIYYDQAGQGIAPHIDAEQTSINVIMMLSHDSPTDRASALVLYPLDKEPERVALSPGEIVVFHAGAITHEREAVSAGEMISIVSFGFRPTGAESMRTVSR